MIGLVVLLWFGFAVAFLLGWTLHRKQIWHYIDLVYYPLLAISAILFYLTMEAQREMIELNQIREKQREALAMMRQDHSGTRSQDEATQLANGVRIIASIKRWVDACEGGSHRIQPPCLAAEKLEPPITAFLATARRDYRSFADQRQATCEAGDRLMSEIRATGAVSSIVADQLLRSYAAAVLAEPAYSANDDLEAHISAYRTEAIAYVQEVHGLAFTSGSESNQRLLAVELAEIDYGEILLRGLSQCFTVPRESLAKFRRWSMPAHSKEDDAAYVEGLMRSLERRTENASGLDLMQFSSWPFFLVIALALKFGKGVAGVRRARRISAKRQRRPERES